MDVNDLDFVAVAKGVVYDHATAVKQGVESTGHAGSARCATIHIRAHFSCFQNAIKI